MPFFPNSLSLVWCAFSPTLQSHCQVCFFFRVFFTKGGNKVCKTLSVTHRVEFGYWQAPFFDERGFMQPLIRHHYHAYSLKYSGPIQIQRKGSLGNVIKWMLTASSKPPGPWMWWMRLCCCVTEGTWWLIPRYDEAFFTRKLALSKDYHPIWKGGVEILKTNYLYRKKRTGNSKCTLALKFGELPLIKFLYQFRYNTPHGPERDQFGFICVNSHNMSCANNFCHNILIC